MMLAAEITDRLRGDSLTNLNHPINAKIDCPDNSRDNTHHGRLPRCPSAAKFFSTPSAIGPIKIHTQIQYHA
jgi:hypothetical protein